MAELIGAASGVLGVAEVGFSLATTLYKYASSVKGAEKELKNIAKDVELTSKVLKQTHEQIQKDRDGKLCTNEAIDVTSDVLQGCRDAFQEVDDELKRSIKTDAGGKYTLSMTSRLKFPLKSNKMELLRANLEKLKTTLLLMLSVLAYGRKISSNQSTTVEVKAEISLEKLQIQNLVLARDEATKRYEEMSAAFIRLESKLAANPYQQDPSSAAPPVYTTFAAIPPAPPLTSPSTSSGRSLPPPPPPYQASSFSKNQPGNTAAFAFTRSRMTENSTAPPRPVGEHLGLCASAVKRLAATIDHATQRWQLLQVLEHNSIAQSLDETTEAITYLERNALQSRDDGAKTAMPNRRLNIPMTTGEYVESELATEEDEVQAAKQEIRFIKTSDVLSTRNALRSVDQADQSGRETLSRLAQQGESIKSNESSSNAAATQSRLASEKASELKQLNRSMFAVPVTHPFTARKREEAIIAAALKKQEERLSPIDDSSSRSGPGQTEPDKRSTALATRARYQFEEDSEDEAMEAEIEESLNTMHNWSKLSLLSQTMGAEISSQNKHIEKVVAKMDRVDDQIAINRARLARIDGGSSSRSGERRQESETSRSAKSAQMNPDILAKMKAFSVSRQAPSSSGAISPGAGSSGSIVQSPTPSGFPAGFKLPPQLQRPQEQSISSQKTKTLGEKRSMKPPGNLPGVATDTSPAPGATGGTETKSPPNKTMSLAERRGMKLPSSLPDSPASASSTFGARASPSHGKATEALGPGRPIADPTASTIVEEDSDSDDSLLLLPSSQKQSKEDRPTLSLPSAPQLSQDSAKDQIKQTEATVSAQRLSDEESNDLPPTDSSPTEGEAEIDVVDDLLRKWTTVAI